MTSTIIIHAGEEEQAISLSRQLESHSICGAHDTYSDAFDRALAAGTGLLDACAVSQSAGSFSVLKTLRLVSKAASSLALQAVQGFTLQLQPSPHDPCQNIRALSAVLDLVPGLKLTRLQVRFPAMQDQSDSTPARSILLSGTVSPQPCPFDFADIDKQLLMFVARMFLMLRSVTHLKIVTGVFGNALTKPDLDMVSRLLNEVATCCPALQELHVEGDVGAEFLHSCSVMCLSLVSLVEAVGSLPPSTVAQLPKLMKRVAMRTVMFEQGDWGELMLAVHAVHAVTTPTTFDLCGRTLLCWGTIKFPTGSKVAIQNGTVHVAKGPSTGLTVFEVQDSEVSFKNVIICQVLVERKLKPLVMVSSKCVSGSYDGITIRKGATVVMHSCEIMGAECAVNIIDLDWELRMERTGHMHTSKFVASHVKLLNPVGGYGVSMIGMASAELTDCVISSTFCAVCVQNKGQLVATRVDMPWNLYVSEGGSARMLTCRFTNKKDSDSCTRVNGTGSHLLLMGCVWYQQEVLGRIQVNEGGQFSVQ